MKTEMVKIILDVIFEILTFFQNYETLQSSFTKCKDDLDEKIGYIESCAGNTEDGAEARVCYLHIAIHECSFSFILVPNQVASLYV